MWRHYLSNATRLMRPHLFYACFVVSMITMTCYIIRHVGRTPELDKSFSTSGPPEHVRHLLGWLRLGWLKIP